MGTSIGQGPPSDEAHEPILRAPRVVTGFIIAFIIVHVASLFLTDAQFQYLIESFALTPERFAHYGWNGEGGVVDTLAAYVPFVTYAFLHGDFVHLIFNSVWFLVFATMVARRVGTGRFLALSLLATLGAAVVHLVFHWGSPVPVVGASGAVSGLMGAAFRFILIDPNSSPGWPRERLPLFSRPVLLASAVWIVLNVLLGITGFAPGGFGRSIAWEAHLGGFFTGLLAFPMFDRRRSWMS
jgi:membrane associated rhomboid family serine protease